MLPRLQNKVCVSREVVIPAMLTLFCANLHRPNCVPTFSQMVAQGYVWVRDIIPPLKTAQPLLFHWALAKVLRVKVALIRMLFFSHHLLAKWD